MTTQWCLWCYQPITLVDDRWCTTGGAACLAENWQNPDLQVKDVYDLPVPEFGGASYREAVFKASPSRWLDAWAARPPHREHTPIETWWWDGWGPVPAYVLDNRRLVAELENALPRSADRPATVSRAAKML